MLVAGTWWTLLEANFCKIVSKTGLVVTAKAATTISPLSGIYFPSLIERAGNRCASAELTSG
ncbi:hypothetical protein [Lapidilactobacillus bayanensis]|uniref:hypothetical protein n=1 Tax=Lapidilactobacillus bayanensis TaxID=2485998 RepID=UPI000F7A20FD|nr:hypothetical protein [Lapidilactobacillus bayanensis]